MWIAHFERCHGMAKIVCAGFYQHVSNHITSDPSLCCLGKNVFLNVLRWTLILGIIVSAGIGVVSLIPGSQYTYVWRGKINPTIIRAGRDDMQRESDPKKSGIVLGLVGLSLTTIYLLVFPL